MTGLFRTVAAALALAALGGSLALGQEAAPGQPAPMMAPNTMENMMGGDMMGMMTMMQQMSQMMASCNQMMQTAMPAQPVPEAPAPGNDPG